MVSDLQKKIYDSFLRLDMTSVLSHVEEIIQGGDEAIALQASESITEALEVVGKRFQEGEWFLAELVYSGEIAKAALELLSPAMAHATETHRGTIVVGTVAGDLHDLGKNIFINYCKSAGFEIIDLGVDVTTEVFVTAVREHRPLALGMSCLLTITAPEVDKVIQSLNKENLREVSKVIIGGAALTESFAVEVKADAFAPDAVTGTDIIKRWSDGT